MNAYETHTTLGHTITRHSPNGIDVIETCDTCGARFLLQSGHAPVSMLPYRPLYTPGDKATVRKWARAQIETHNRRIRGE